MGTGNLTLTGGSSGTITDSGTISNSGNITLNANSSGPINVSGPAVSNTGSIASAGTGTGTITISAPIGPGVSGVTQSDASDTLVLSKSNSYTGPTTISAGTLQIGNGTSGEYLASTSIGNSRGACV